eukprot:1187730-Prorocentrum_minimum.AAC.1
MLCTHSGANARGVPPDVGSPPHLVQPGAVGHESGARQVDDVAGEVKGLHVPPGPLQVLHHRVVSVRSRPRRHCRNRGAQHLLRNQYNKGEVWGVECILAVIGTGGPVYEVILQQGGGASLAKGIQ